LRLLADVHAAPGDTAGATDARVRAAKADNGKDEILALSAAKHTYEARRYDDTITVAQLGTKANDTSLALWGYLALAQVGKQD
ncbi:hypothetical protein, partial [Salmonella sp. SAL4447]|uniref:hypothetical protein n=1 Tax=Salmonella sp. SAL4447 TaxID=3159902 RepID=UPI00397DCCD2